MANAYTQDIVLDADGKPVLDALSLVQKFMGDIQKVVTGIGVTSIDDAKKWQQQLALNLKMLKQAESDLRTLQTDRQNRNKGFADFEKQARDIARAEVAADKEANRQKLVEAKVYYGEKARAAKQEADQEKAIAKEIAEYERSQDRAAIASAKEVAAARREAAQAAVTSKARGITNADDASAAKAASDQRLSQLRREREAVAANDVASARAIADRITIEKALGRELDATIRKLDQQTAAEQRAQDAATRRLQGVGYRDQTLLAPSAVQSRANTMGTSGALDYYKGEQATAQSILRARIADTRATAEQRVEAQKNLEIANRRVAEAQKLVNEENRVVAAQERQQRAAERVVQQEQRANEQAARRAAQEERNAQREQARSPLGRIKTAATNLGLYGGVAGLGYAAIGAVQGGVTEVLQMEDELAKLQAIANATESQLQQMKGAIYGIGEASRFSNVDLAKIAQTLAQAGVNSTDMDKVLGSVTRLATASGSTPDEAVNLVTSALGAFQLQASESARIADLMTSALNRTKLTVQQTGQAIQYVGATAFEQNISLEQLLSTVGAIAQAGVRSGSTIGTGFRQFLVDLQTPSEKLTAQLKAVGLSASDVNVAVRGLPAVLNSLKEAGFGSAQAYGGLETRAAAFYLVAKNNVDIMQQLQMSFAQQGAAAIANERAMNSLTAQWQRFKNILSEGLAESLDEPMIILKNLLTSISDKITEQREIAEGIRERSRNGTASFMERDLEPFLRSGVTTNLDLLGLLSGTGVALGSELDKLSEKSNGAAASQEIFETRIAKASEKVEAQAGRVSELDKEMSRLLTQQDSLKDNTLGVATETITLTARFEGLAKFLTNAKDRYGDLIQAMQKYRHEAVQTQQAYLNSQISLFGQQADAAQNSATSLANQALNNPRFQNDATLMRALRQPRVGANSTIIAEAGERYKDSTLRQLSQELGTLAISISQGNLARTQRNNAVAENTAAGQSLGQRATAVESRLTAFSSLDQTAQRAQAPALRTAAQDIVNEVRARLANPNTARSAIPTLQQYLTRGEAVLKGVQAALAPTKAEDAAAKRAERAADKAEKLVKQSDIDAVGQALGLNLGSGTRTPREQEDLHARGLTPARGFGPRTSNHVGGVARDFSVRGKSDEEAERLAATMRAQYRAQGINADVRFETGRGKNQGSGRHIHVGVAKGATRRADRSAETEDRNGVQLAKDQISLDEDDLKTKIKDIAKATTVDTFNSAVTAARAALDKVNAELKPAALDELAAAGIAPGSTQFKLKMSQVQQEIEQNTADFNQKIADGIVKSAKAQIDAAQTAFDAAVAPAQARLAISQAQVTGLDSYSLRGEVPSFVKALANDRTAQGQENVTRAQYAASPALIAAQQAAIANATATAATNGVTPETTAQIAQMNVELQKLIANRDALAAQLSAGDLVPTTLTDGLNQAVQAYRQANNMTLTWQQSLMNEMGPSIDFAGSQVTDFFTNIMTGSTSALGAFKSFSLDMVKYAQQMIAKFIAMKAINFLLGLAVSKGVASPFAGDGVGAPMVLGADSSGLSLGQFHGGPAGTGRVIYRRTGGAVENGSTAADSVDTRLARGEWVVQKDAVDSVGNQFMARLNQHGAKALDGLQAMPSLDMKSHTETNVYVVPPAQQPTMGPNDVRVVLNDELMNGDAKRLVQHISRER